MHFLGQFKHHSSRRKHGNQTNDPIFSSAFSALTVCNIHVYFSKWSKLMFMWSPSFGLFWSVKYVNFGQKLPIKTNHYTFLESIHPDVTKNPYYVLSSKGSQKQVSAPGRIPVCRGVYIHYFKINSSLRSGLTKL